MMPQTPRVFTFAALKGTAWTALARVLGNDGAAIKQADFGTINCRVFSQAANAETFDQNLTVASVVFDTNQNDARWTQDATGYNFLFQVPASAFANLGNHRVDFTFTPTGEESFGLTFEGVVRSKGLGDGV